jgi:hypothetical protein
MKRLTCECGKVLGYEPRHAGKKVKCGGCGKALTVPSEEDKNAPLAMQPLEDEEPSRVKSRPPARKHEDEEEYPPRPAKRKKAYKDEEPDTTFGRRDTTLNHVANYFAKNALFPVLFCAMGLLLPWGIYEYLITRNASSTPQRIDANELSEKGPGNNYHVIVTGARPGAPFVWVKQSPNPAGGKRYTEYLGFFVPLDSRGDGSFRVLLKSDLTDEDKFMEVLKRGEYHGTIMNSVDSLSEKEQEALRKAYPNTDFSRVWIIEEGREPRSPIIVLLLFVFGIVGPVAGGAVFAIMAMYRTSADA